MGKSPAFQCYPAELFNDEAVKLMSNREFGIYWKLICHSWTEKSIPADLEKLAVIVNEDPRDFESMWPKMSFKFRKKRDRLLHKRVERERAKQKQFSQEQSMRARQIGSPKMAQNGPKTAPPSEPDASRTQAGYGSAGLKPGMASPSSSSSSASSKTKTTTPLPPIFQPPRPEDVSAYSESLGHKIDGLHFVAYYQARDWKIKNKPVKNWKACVVTWIRNDRTKTGKFEEMFEKFSVIKDINP